MFYLRKTGKFSNGEPITARDFVYTMRRALDPENAFRNANLAYYIKYAEPLNTGSVFVKDQNGQFLLKKDLAEKDADAAENPAPSLQASLPDSFGPDTEFNKFIDAPERFAISGNSFERARAIEKEPRLKEVFKLYPKDLKNATGFVNKVKNGTSAFSQFLREQIGQDTLNTCAAQESCNDSAKQAIADSLNKIFEGGIFDKSKFAGNELPVNSQKLYKSLEAENEKRAKANQALDEEIAKLTDEAKKQEKEKEKKQPITKLAYFNRVLLEDIYKDEIEASPIVPVKGEDLGIEAIDDYTLRIKLYQPAPYFLDLLPHQFFRVLHQGTIEKFGKGWIRPENIVTSGPYKVEAHRPYDELIVVKDTNNWDAANVKLDRIEFYPLEEATTMMNLYKAGSVDAIYNHTTPAAWNEEIRKFKDEYMNHPEVAVEYYSISVKKPPMDNLKVRQAFSLAIDREALAKFRKTTKPLTDFTPEGIFPKYEEARKRIYAEELQKAGISQDDWKKRTFDPERARRLLTEAGYPVVKAGNGWSCPTFPVEQVQINYNTAESNKAAAEFNQAQWKQNLGIEIPMKNMEWKTFLSFRSKVEYQGFARNGWVGDYMDPFTFLNLFYSQQNDGATGWWDPKYDKMLDDANRETDPTKRFEMLARAEFYVISQQVVIPLQTQATNWIKKPYVKGLYPNPGTLHPWKFVYIERDPNRWDKDVDNIMKESDPSVEDQINKLTESQKRFEQTKTATAAL
jgi:ABC-type oligopeptide transport system substrate-binding subunit